MEQINIGNNNTTKKKDYLIAPAFRNINRFFVLSFKNDNNDPTRDSFDKYCIPLVEIKDFNALIDNKPFFDKPVEKTRSVWKNLIEMLKNSDYTTENLLNYLYHQNYYKLIGIDLSRQIN